MITTNDIPETLMGTNPNYTVVKVNKEFYQVVVSQLSGLVFHKEVDGEYFVKAGRKSITYVTQLGYMFILSKIKNLGIDVQNFKHKDFVITCMGNGEDFDTIAAKVVELEKSNA